MQGQITVKHLEKYVDNNANVHKTFLIQFSKYQESVKLIELAKGDF
jgi:hypothetical protein